MSEATEAEPDTPEIEDTTAVEDFAMADASAQTWFRLFQRLAYERYPVGSEAESEIGTRIVPNIVAAAERDCLVACFDAMANIARKFSPSDESGPPITFDFSRIGRG